MAVFFFLFTHLVRGNLSIQQMEKICSSDSCRNLISSNSCLALNKHEVREAPISNQSRQLTFSANLCAHRHHGGGGCVGRGALSWAESLIMAVELTRLMRACLHPLMLAAISRMTKCYDPSCGKSPDTCRGKLYFDTTPLGLKMTVSALWWSGSREEEIVVYILHRLWKGGAIKF